jgi:cell division protein FtsL
MKEIYYIKSVDNSRWVPPSHHRVRAPYGAWLLAGALLLSAGLFSAQMRYQSRANGYRLEQLERQRQQLTELNRKLRLQEASLVDPLRIDSIARNELGMTTLAPDQIYRGAEVPPAALVAQRRP